MDSTFTYYLAELVVDGIDADDNAAVVAWLIAALAAGLTLTHTPSSRSFDVALTGTMEQHATFVTHTGLTLDADTDTYEL